MRKTLLTIVLTLVSVMAFAQTTRDTTATTLL